MEAKSLTLYFEDDSDPERGAVLSELADDMVQEGCDFMTIVRQDRRKPDYFSGSEEGQLFDLESDPDETVNLWDSSGQGEVRRKQIHEILDWRLQSSRRTQSFVARETLC